MKEKLKFKPLVIILIFISIFQYVSMIVPFLGKDIYAYSAYYTKYTIELNGCNWEYIIDAGPRITITRLIPTYSWDWQITTPKEITVPSQIQGYDVYTGI